MSVAKKRKTEENCDNYVASIENENDDASGLGFLLGAHSFEPLHLLAEWEHPIHKTKMVTVAVLLPSGVSTGAWHTSVESGGSVLELTVSWPVSLLDMKVLHSKWLHPKGGYDGTFSQFHPQFLALENALRGLRDRVTDGIESTALFPLPFPVETHIYFVAPLAHKPTGNKIL